MTINWIQAAILGLFACLCSNSVWLDKRWEIIRLGVLSRRISLWHYFRDLKLESLVA